MYIKKRLILQIYGIYTNKKEQPQKKATLEKYKNLQPIKNKKLENEE